MAMRKPQWPEAGDLVIATIKQVTDYCAYAKLDQYQQRGLLHVSEISSSSIRNIHNFTVMSSMVKVGGQGTFKREK
jgi:translation initiation factor 2 alpha subunit (eIF-2alpha)